jgi:2'-5' RNA ligase
VKRVKGEGCLRLFLGVELDDAVRAACADAAAQLRVRLTELRADVTARWVDPENLHITVWFIGEANDERAHAITSVLQPGFATPAFDLVVRGSGAFPSSARPRVFWIGVTDGRASMGQLSQEVKARLVPPGFDAGKVPYSPHVTIARVKEAGRGAARQVRDALAGVPADCGSCRVRAVTLFRSRLSPHGSKYEPLLRVPLS